MYLIIMVTKGEEEMYNVKELAVIMKCHPATIKRYINAGKLKAIKVGKEYRVTEEQWQDFLQQFSK